MKAKFLIISLFFAQLAFAEPSLPSEELKIEAEKIRVKIEAMEKMQSHYLNFCYEKHFYRRLDKLYNRLAEVEKQIAESENQE